MFFRTVLLTLITSVTLLADVLETIKMKELMHVGIKYEHRPLAFIADNGKIVGFEVDLIQYIADLNNVNVKFHQVTASDRVKMLKEGKVDLIIATMDQNLSEDLLTTKPYFFDALSLLVYSDEKASSLDEFANRIIGTLKGESSAELLEQYFTEARVVSFAEYPQAMRSFSRKNIGAILADHAWSVRKRNDFGDKFRVMPLELANLSYVMGVRKGEEALLKVLNEGIDSFVNEGIYDETYEKWLGVEPKKRP